MSELSFKTYCIENFVDCHKVLFARFLSFDHHPVTSMFFLFLLKVLYFCDMDTKGGDELNPFFIYILSILDSTIEFQSRFLSSGRA